MLAIKTEMFCISSLLIKLFFASQITLAYFWGVEHVFSFWLVRAACFGLFCFNRESNTIFYNSIFHRLLEKDNSYCCHVANWLDSIALGKSKCEEDRLNWAVING